eukprot:4363944-Pleurochrysis_carterae.AAC.3
MQLGLRLCDFAVSAIDVASAMPISLAPLHEEEQDEKETSFVQSTEEGGKSSRVCEIVCHLRLLSRFLVSRHVGFLRNWREKLSLRWRELLSLGHIVNLCATFGDYLPPAALLILCSAALPVSE